MRITLLPTKISNYNLCMLKTAQINKISEYVIERCKTAEILEEFKKEAFINGIGGNWVHLLERLARVPDKSRAIKVMNSIANTARKLKVTKGKGLPVDQFREQGWYRPILDESGKVEGYIVGQGNYLSTILDANMRPNGQLI